MALDMESLEQDPRKPVRMRKRPSGRKEAKPAGFFLRLLASLFDCVILSVVNMVIMRPVAFKATGMVSKEELSRGLWALQPDDPRKAWFLGTFILMVIAWLYSSIMEHSELQATVGKRIVGIKVADMNGSRITFKRALARNLCKILSFATLLAGFLMSAFTKRRQALHDLLSRTQVLQA